MQGARLRTVGIAVLGGLGGRLLFSRRNLRAHGGETRETKAHRGVAIAVGGRYYKDGGIVVLKAAEAAIAVFARYAFAESDQFLILRIVRITRTKRRNSPPAVRVYTEKQ